MVAAVSKLMRVQDLIYAAKKISVVTRFRTTVGLPGRLSTRLQPNHPTDDAVGIAASMLDGLLLGSGDAVVGVNPASDNVGTVTMLLRMMEHVRVRYGIPMQSRWRRCGRGLRWIWCSSRLRGHRRRMRRLV
jgi:ethanolamine ammonia-lyase large subunit